MTTMKKFSRLAAAVFTLGLIFSSGLAISQVVFGLVAGPVGVGYPQLRVVNGTASNPSVLFASDNNSGIFQPAAGLISTAAGGVEAERVGATFNAKVASIAAVSSASSVTLTAAQLTGGVINRTGVGAAQTDTTDTAANIDTALGSPPVGMSFQYSYANATANSVTMAGGSNVTIIGTATYPASVTKVVTCVKTAATPTYSCG